MRFVYGRQDAPDRVRAQEDCYLLTNGLGDIRPCPELFP